MGLFNRRAETKQELEELRAELNVMRRRLDETEFVKQQLADQVTKLGAAQEQLNGHVGEVRTKVGTVESQVETVAGSIGPAIDSAVVQAASVVEVDQLRTELGQLGTLASTVEQLRESLAAQQLAAASHDGAVTEEQSALSARLEELAAALAQQQAQLADVALVATDAAERTDAALDDMRATAAGTTDRDTELRSQLGQLAEKVGAIDARVNQVSLELTNQLTELSGDLDRASAQADASDLVEQLAEQLKDVTGGQERLANEQARYAIQFREDLAELADRLRRPGRS